MSFPVWVRKIRDSAVATGDRLVRRVALGVGLITFAAGHGNAEPRVPVNATPDLVPDVEARKLGGKYVLQRARTGPRVIFASHVSHSSHSSHASHASHSSGSHYSGSHYSSSPSAPAPPTPAPKPQPVYVPPPAPVVAPVEIKELEETFENSQQTALNWRKGLLIHQLLDYDRAVALSEEKGFLEIVPRSRVAGKHFHGYVSHHTYDLTKSRISGEVLQVPNDGAAATFVLGIDLTHWIAFRGTASALTFESRSGSEHSETKVPYDAKRHRFWRFRRSADSDAVMWETSADGRSWHVQHSAEVSFPITALYLELAAGTTRSVKAPGRAAFDNIEVVTK